MSTVPYWKETKMMDLVERILHVTSHYQILTFIDGTVGHVFCDCYDIMLLTKGEGPHCWLLGGKL